MYMRLRAYYMHRHVDRFYDAKACDHVKAMDYRLGARGGHFPRKKRRVLEDFYVFKLISVKTASKRDFGASWARFGPLGSSFWGPGGVIFLVKNKGS